MANPTESEIDRIISGMNRASDAADYGETIRCEMQQVAGDNYQMLWSTQYSGPFEPNT